ncbi:MAG: YceI family protein [Bifidobacteriaceae bacterium]|jgi:polyisoprenoid-binding protein YceI|nr:YceI family protein [Bifidobacteriaceae bacterium]
MNTRLPAGLTPGAWALDPAHSSTAFSVRHAGLAKVRGAVAIKDGVVVIGADLEDSSARAVLDPTTVFTGDGRRDAHLAGADFFGAAEFPEWTFVSTSVAPGLPADPDAPPSAITASVAGQLTLHGVAQPVDLQVEFDGVGLDADGRTLAGFSAATELSREDFGLTWNGKTAAGNALVADAVHVRIEVTAVRPD